MIESGFWHPVALSGDLGGQPKGVTLLEQALVLWRDGAGTAYAWADQCPHRGAKFSLGKVVDGKLECAYHGWQFQGSPGGDSAAEGRCVHAPAVPGFVPPPSHCALTYEAREKYGLVWVRMTRKGQSAMAESPLIAEDLPAFAAESDPQLRKVNCGPYDVNTSAPRIVENFLDMSHFGFVHDGYLGVGSHTAIDDYQVAATEHGLLATQCRAWQPRSNLNSTVPAQVEYTYEVTAPFGAVLTKVPDAASIALPVGMGSYRESIALFICPVGPETCRVWFRMAVADFASTDAALREFQHTIFMQDKPVLESQTPKRLPLQSVAGRKAEVHTAADKASSAYRRHLVKLGIQFGIC